jgi:predicted XRE-type DNA-binding protein
MMRKGRGAIGTKHGNAILNPDLVRLIRRLSSEGVSQRRIAAVIGVSQSAVSAVITRRLWRHVEDGVA